MAALPKSELETADADVFSRAAVISNSEVLTMLQEYQKQRREQNPAFVMPPLVQKTFEYVQKFKCSDNPAAMATLRQLCEQNGLRGYEWGLVANLIPETAEEAIALMPSLQDDPDEPPEEQRHYTTEDVERILGSVMHYRSIN